MNVRTGDLLNLLTTGRSSRWGDGVMVSGDRSITGYRGPFGAHYAEEEMKLQISRL